MNVIITLFLSILFLYGWFYNRKNISTLLISICFFMGFCRIAFLNSMLSNTLILIFRLIQTGIFITAIVIFIVSVINKIKIK